MAKKSSRKDPAALFGLGPVTSASERKKQREASPDAGSSDVVEKPVSAMGQAVVRASQATTQMVEELREELDALKKAQAEAVEAGRQVIEIPLEKVVLPEEYNREAFAYSDEAFQEFVESIRKHGQDVPAKVRPLEDGRYELVAGYRRYHACRVLGIPIRAIAASPALSPVERALEKWRENEQRLNWSAIERGRLFSSWLDNGLFSSITELAEAIGRHRSRVSRAITISQIPEDLLSTFQDVRSITEKQGGFIAQACAQSKASHRQLLELATSLTERPGMSDRVLFQQLVKEAKRLLATPSNSEEEKKDAAQEPQAPLVTIKQRRGKPVLEFSPEVPRDFLERLLSEIPSLLEAHQNTAASDK